MPSFPSSRSKERDGATPTASEFRLPPTSATATKTPSGVREMESTKRKREADGLPMSSPSGEYDRTGSDEEVEEFFAILRRMRDVSRRFVGASDGGGSGRPRAADGSMRVAVRWNPAFEWEDFAAPGSGKDDGGKGRLETAEAEAPAPAPAVVESGAENATPRRLDLNADPEPEGLVVASPRSDSTAPRCARALA